MNIVPRFFCPPKKNRSRVHLMCCAPERKAALRENDQFIVSFPRSGNTWMRILLREVIILQRPDLPPPRNLNVLLPTMHKPGPDDGGEAAFGLKTRIFKSHNIPDVFGRRMVYLFREPGDSLVSFFHFRHREAEKVGKPFEQSIDGFCRRIAPKWCEHLTLGLEQAERHPDRTLLLAYETLHANTANALRAAVDFLGIPASDGQIADGVERASFQHLRAREEKRTEGKGSLFFFRKGRIGSSAEELLVETIEFIARRAGPLYQRALAASRSFVKYGSTILLSSCGPAFTLLGSSWAERGDVEGLLILFF
jgi:hypothetical protein